MSKAMKQIKVGDKVRHTFSTEAVGIVLATRSDPSGYDTQVAFRSPLDDKVTTDWFKNSVLYFDSDGLTKPEKENSNG